MLNWLLINFLKFNYEGDSLLKMLDDLLGWMIKRPLELCL